MTGLDEARQTIAANNRVLQSILDRAYELAAAGEHEAAAVTAQIGAEFASRNHPGVFASHRLEALLRLIARQTCARDMRREPRRADAAGPSRILHVLSQAHAKGGHSRLAWRWIANDDNHIHSVALTDQGTAPVPQPLLDAMKARGGTIERIDRASAQLLGRARALQACASRADYVVLHVHPFDVTPTLAFAAACARPTIVFMNHSDHLFWVGASLADHMVLFRETGKRLAVERRYIAAERCSVVPLPLEGPVRRQSRREAKASLGIDPQDVICLTIGFSYKFNTPEPARHLTSLVRPVFEANARARLIAIGPSLVGSWKAASEALDGRIVAIGEQSDIKTYLEAADIFLMPTPVGSTTAALEAGAYGMPVIEFCDPALAEGVFGTDSPGLRADVVMRADSPVSYRAMLADLLRDEDLRARLGARIQAGIVATHFGPGWQAQLDAALEIAAAKPPRQPADEPEPRPLFTPTDVKLCGMRPGLLARLGLIVGRQAKSLPLRRRLGLYLHYYRHTGPVAVRHLAIELAVTLMSRRQLGLIARTLETTGLFRRLFENNLLPARRVPQHAERGA